MGAGWKCSYLRSFLLLATLSKSSTQSQDGSLKFSSAVLPESFQSLNTELHSGSGETFRNFYSKTKDIEVDEDLIKQLKLAQKAIDNGQDEEDYPEDEYENNH